MTWDPDVAEVRVRGKGGGEICKAMLGEKAGLEGAKEREEGKGGLVGEGGREGKGKGYRKWEERELGMNQIMRRKK